MMDCIEHYQDVSTMTSDDIKVQEQIYTRYVAVRLFGLN